MFPREETDQMLTGQVKWALKVDSRFSHAEVPGGHSKNILESDGAESLSRLRLKRICGFKRICNERN